MGCVLPLYYYTASGDGNFTELGNNYHFIDFIDCKREISCLKVGRVKTLEQTAVVDAVVEVVTLDFDWIHRQRSTVPQHRLFSRVLHRRHKYGIEPIASVELCVPEKLP